MSLVQKVTNLYLYGQETTPSDLTDESLIRPDSLSENPILNVNVQDYMQNGGGRFAIGSQDVKADVITSKDFVIV